MTDHVSDADDLSPRNRRMRGSGVGRNMARSFGNAGDVALDHLAQTFIGQVVVDRLARG
jgi:hypothetical protein